MLKRKLAKPPISSQLGIAFSGRGVVSRIDLDGAKVFSIEGQSPRRIFRTGRIRVRFQEYDVGPRRGTETEMRYGIHAAARCQTMPRRATR